MQPRYASRVRTALARARNDAARLGYPRLAPAHIVSAVLDDVAIPPALAAAKIDVAGARASLDARRHMPAPPAPQNRSGLPYTLWGKLVLEFAADYATRSGGGAVDLVSVLIGALQADANLADDLATFGITVERLSSIRLDPPTGTNGAAVA